jgi:CRISPR-associated endoribonuclease Cas6
MPMGMTFFMKALGDAPPTRFDREWTDRLLGEMAFRAGVPEEALQKRPAPFAISSPLPAEGHRPGGEADPDEVGRFRLRLSWLVDADLEGLLDWARSLRGDPVRVETNCGQMLFEDAQVSPTLTERWNRWVPYDRLYEEASDCLRVVTLKFYSPTTLERSGLPYPLPDPCGMFRGYSRTWDAFSGIALASGLREAIEKHLLLVDFRIQRRRSEVEQGPVPAFIGSATFRLAGRHPESVLKGLNALADYAFFCGTGIGTEHGMGLTRRILEDEGRT